MRTSLIVNKPIVLVGMMGSGKSTIGRKLANKLNVQFYDSDTIIEEREGHSISDIHYYRGEEYFKNKEIEVITEILNYGPVVLSTGGSSFMIDEVREVIAQRALSIWLSANVDTISERVSRRNTRPTLDVPNQKEVVEKMIADGENFYSKADVKIESGEMDAHHVVDSLLLKLQDSFPTENRILKYG